LSGYGRLLPHHTAERPERKRKKEVFVAHFVLDVGDTRLPESYPVIGSTTLPNAAAAGNYSGYLVPTNADIPELDALFVDGFDEEASPLGAKGLGELSAVSVAPAITNAVYHATGTRVRDLPITIEKLL
jgi:CO/xanthine dehydrogenase Mo-binding subunit